MGLDYFFKTLSTSVLNASSVVTWFLNKFWNNCLSLSVLFITSSDGKIEYFSFGNILEIEYLESDSI